MRITILIDNHARDGLLSEWGLAAHIEYEGHSILLDTGASGKFIENARALGIDIAAVEVGVLSHAHYDHADGLPAFFAANSAAPFYLRDAARENCYAKKFIFRKYIGIPKDTDEKYADRIVRVSGDAEIFPGVFLVPHKAPNLAAIGKRNAMYIKDRSGFRPDDFAHEQSLVLRTPSGLVILNSCSHGGADSIVKEVAATFPGEPPRALIGGLHLFKTPAAEVSALAESLRQTGLQALYTDHCTGKPAIEILSKALPDTVHTIYSGMTITL